jgi:hypothetical protein
MIRDLLLPALVANFPNRGFRTGDSPNAIGIFPAAHAEVGDVTIWDDGDEATVGIGEITHGHFNPYDETLTEQQIAERVTSDVVAFLTDLFADRVLLWKSLNNGAGGWQVLEGENDFSLMDAEALTYLWSGPVTGLLYDGARPGGR